MDSNTIVDFEGLTRKIWETTLIKHSGRVSKIVGLVIEAEGITPAIGEVCEISPDGQEITLAEVVGFRDKTTILMPLGDLRGVRPGSRVISTQKELTITVGQQLYGKVLDGLGKVISAEAIAGSEIKVNNSPPNPLERTPITKVMQTGIKVLDSLLTFGQGQRLGIFAGSGVGKSTLLGMLARGCEADINVIAMVGERGREVREFIDYDLGNEGLRKSVVITATSDQPALVRVKAAFVATAIAEYFRDMGKSVMFMMDSLTRFAMAQREIGLAVGEPPATRGYTPSVFALLPQLLERTGTNSKGSITAVYSVLVEGDDLNEPIADAVRGILDGHIVLTRELAHRNHFPAVDVLQSNSRLMNRLVSPAELAIATTVRDILANYRQVEDLVNIGAYVPGTNPGADRAIKYYPKVTKFLEQNALSLVRRADTLAEINKLLGDLGA